MSKLSHKVWSPLRKIGPLLVLVIVSLMENIDFWWPASVHYIQGMSHKMVRSHNCSLGPQTAPWGRADSRTETIMCADLSSLLSGAESEDREPNKWQSGCEVSAALYTCCVSDKCDIFSLLSFLPSPQSRHMSRLWAATRVTYPCKYSLR